MMKWKTFISLALVSAIVLISGCATTRTSYSGRKNHLVKDIPANQDCGSCNLWDKLNDWYRIANMTDAEICKALNCPERVVTKEVQVYSTVTTVITKEVPGPERVITKEVPVEKVIESKPMFVLPGAFFDFDKDTLKPTGKIELDKAAVTLKDNGYPSIVISGHTDAIGSDAYNLKLSQRRTDTVKKYLEEKGVPASTMSTKGYGKTKPIASNKTDDGQAQNRRVEIHLANP